VGPRLQSLGKPAAGWSDGGFFRLSGARND
jgi:hypothetical protein